MACRSLIYIVDASKDVIQIIQEGSVPKVEVATTLTYTCDVLALVNTPVALAATLVNEENQPVSGADISFQVAAQSCSALTGADGVASCDVTIGTAGVYQVTAEFAMFRISLPQRRLSSPPNGEIGGVSQTRRPPYYLYPLHPFVSFERNEDADVQVLYRSGGLYFPIA